MLRVYAIFARPKLTFNCLLDRRDRHSTPRQNKLTYTHWALRSGGGAVRQKGKENRSEGRSTRKRKTFPLRALWRVLRCQPSSLRYRRGWNALSTLECCPPSRAAAFSLLTDEMAPSSVSLPHTHTYIRAPRASYSLSARNGMPRRAILSIITNRGIIIICHRSPRLRPLL